MRSEQGVGGDVVPTAGQQLHDQSAAAITASMVLNGRGQAAMRRSRALEADSIKLRSTAKAQYLRGRRAREHGFRPRPIEPVRGLIGFRVEGVVDGEAVAARWRNGRLRCDRPLQERALLLVELGEELVYTDPPRRFKATLRGRPVEVALTLLRACDRVTAFQVDLPSPAGVLS